MTDSRETIIPVEALKRFDANIDNQLIERLLDRVQTAYSTFKTELLIYRFGSIAAMLMIIFAAGRSIIVTTPGPIELGTFLGAGGLFAITGERTTFFLRDYLRLLELVITNSFPRGEK